jgi:hypothetical protein
VPAMELVVVAGCAVLAAACASIVARRRRNERVARRAAALAEVARRVDTAVSELEDLPVGTAQPVSAAPAHREAVERSGREAFVADVAAAVAQARERGSRLALALVSAGEALSPATTDALRHAAGVPVYAAGTRSAALVLSGLGRAGALGVLARIQLDCGLRGHAVELEPDEDATELVVRLLAPDVLRRDT